MAHDLGAIRKESIRLALYRAGDNPLLADAAYEAFFIKRNEVAFYEDALPALKLLSSRYPLVSLSNGNAQLSMVGIAPYFKAGISAKNTGASKPSPLIFEVAAQTVGVKPEQVLHVGDDAALDVLGALNAGMQAVWLNRQSKAWVHSPAQPSLEITYLSQLTDLLCPN
jgi:FMN hydrolase / 5-amino-6-(5-phospho-D-ribitylamino)uracil phosphatase